MHKLLYVLLALFIANPAFAAMHSLYVGTGVATNPVGAGDAYITTDMEIDGAFVGATVAIPVDDVTPDVAGGNTLVTGINTVPTAITALDNELVGATYTIITGDVANASTIADAGNFALNGAWAPATIGDSITLYVVADDDYYEVARSYVVPGPGIFTTVDGTDATFTGDLSCDGNFVMGQEPDDLHTGYKARGDFITYQDDFMISVDTEYILDWDLTTVVGGGTNTVTVRPGWSEMVTGGTGVDSESVQSFGLIIDRAFTPRMESVVEFTDLVTQRFEWGFYIGAAEYAMIVYDVAVGANWVLQLDDTTGVETIDSTIPATVDPTKIEIVVDAAGNVTWALDDVAMPLPSGATLMTANPHYIWWRSTDTAAAAHTTAVDYVIVEQLRQQ